MGNQELQLEFNRWVADEFYRAYRSDQLAATQQAKEKARVLGADDRKLLALTYANRANAIKEMGDPIGRSHMMVWLVAGIVSAAIYFFGGEAWAALPLVMALSLAIRNLVTSNRCVEAYNHLCWILNLDD